MAAIKFSFYDKHLSFVYCILFDDISQREGFAAHIIIWINARLVGRWSAYEKPEKFYEKEFGVLIKRKCGKVLLKRLCGFEKVSKGYLYTNEYL